jgi:hypothetical protein
MSQQLVRQAARRSSFRCPGGTAQRTCRQGTPARRSGGRRAEPHLANGMPWSGRLNRALGKLRTMTRLGCCQRLSGAGTEVNDSVCAMGEHQPAQMAAICWGYRAP